MKLVTMKEKPMTALDKLDAQIEILSDNAQDPKEVADCLELLRKREDLRKCKRIKTPSPDAIMATAANLLGIAAILHHEQLNVITTKALSFVIKGRV